MKSCLTVVAVAVCVTVQVTAADAVLAAVDAGSDVEASDDDDNSNDNGNTRDVSEVDESESDAESSDNDVPLAQTLKKKKCSAKQVAWQKCSNFVGPTPAVDSSENRDKLENRREWGKVDYFEQYIDKNIFEQICDSTNRRSVKDTGKSLNCTIAEIKNFFGIALLTGCLNFPQIRMYWSGVTRVPRIASAMQRDRFFQDQKQPESR